MKVFDLCICALAYISLTSSMTIINKIASNGNEFMNNCIIEADMTYGEDYDVRDIINDAIDKPELEERTQKHGCFIECLLRKMNWMEGSELKEENLYADINTIFANHTLKIQINEFIRDCVGKVKHTTEERCQRGIVAMKCSTKNIYRLFPSSLNKDENEDKDEKDEEKKFKFSHNSYI